MNNSDNNYYYDCKYKLCEHTGYYTIFRFIDSNNSYIEINLGTDYPNYKLPQDGYAYESWHYTIIENNNKKNNSDNNFNKGKILLFNRNNIRKHNARPIFFYEKFIKYRKTTQYEYDKYMFQTDKTSDNSKLFCLLQTLYKDYKDPCKSIDNNTIINNNTIIETNLDMEYNNNKNLKQNNILIV